MQGSHIGTHRSVEPPSALPISAWRLDNRPELAPGEARLAVTHLLLEAPALTSFLEASGGDPGRVRAAVLETVAERGKLHEPRSGTGGGLLGRLDGIGDGPGPHRIGSVVALPGCLAATPLWLTDISGWDGRDRIVPASGHAIAFAATPLVTVPDDLPVRSVLPLLELAPVAAHVRAHVRRDDRFAVVGCSPLVAAVAAVAAREGGARPPVVLVSSLQEVRLVEQVGAGVPLVAPPDDHVAAANDLVDTLGGAPDTVLVGDDDRTATAVLSVAAGGTVLATADVDTGGVTSLAGVVGATATTVVIGGPAALGADLVVDLVRTWPALMRAVTVEAATASDQAAVRWP